MTMIITGSAGFLGRNAMEYYRHLAPIGIDIADGRDCRKLFAIGESRGIDTVLHFAANVGGRQNIDGNPLWIAENHSIDVALFQWAIRNPQAKVLYPSSSAAYPIKWQQRDEHRKQLEERDIDWDHPDLPDSVYGWVKLTGEHLANRAIQAGADIRVIRPMSGYGTDQDTTYPFGAFLARAKERMDPFPIWGDGRQVRDWVHGLGVETFVGSSRVGD